VNNTKFELSLQLNKLSTAYNLAKEANDEEKWKQLGDSGLKNGELGLARECLINAQDLGSLLSLCMATGDGNGLYKVAQKSKQEGLYNVAFASYFALNKISDCIDLLIEANRIPEAAFLARTYAPSRISEIVKLWREDLKTVSVKAADSLADPEEYPNLFPEMEYALKAESYLKKINHTLPANSYLNQIEQRKRDLIHEIKEGTLDIDNIQEDTKEEEIPDTKEILVEEPTTNQNVIEEKYK